MTRDKISDGKKDFECIEVICLVLPTGETLWFEAERGNKYLQQIIEKWKLEHPEFCDTSCSMGAVHITMPKYIYVEITNGKE